jgi:hypothetical protein
LGEKEEYPFAQLVRSPAEAHEVFKAICSALKRSFDEDERRLGSGFRSKIETQAEVERRTEIMCGWFRTLRNECSYSTQRAISVLPDALRTELDGGKYEPPKAEGMYTDGQAIQGEA